MPAGVHQTAPDTDRPVLGTFKTYAEAQALVDRLSDAGFPVEHCAIVGEGLQFVEKVTGRLNPGKAALQGAGSGAVLGLFIGLLLGAFTLEPGGWVNFLLMCVLYGAILGAIFRLLTYLLTGGKRDFSSVGSLAAQRFKVLCDAEFTGEARRAAGLDGSAADGPDAGEDAPAVPAA
ncbi:general stress protein [Phycisphaera mikurensis]|uniref:General stress protein 17M-like domain-containing protein n=1 Tax=Phycisphaera mikurensis (strain NBRC 102666 / KCTC 22515 / FYK2301M01) TaxID=1142394 RepID=I0ICD8_PHYMF|nr:general stress protein [Phycisphaera mikurensis]MBB6442196.1 hypothetical protein [Phycisphaera mikurensis]BAM02926.1 hypothetical protein PSMK_07670 [Phycisphaera mikurensis NBRC 102666]